MQRSFDYDYTIADLLGKTLVRAEKVNDERIEFDAADGEAFAMYHRHDCCESVVIDDITGDLQDLIGSPILEAEEVSNADYKPGPRDYEPESETWTFYKIGTRKGAVTLRWHGESNGYYGETASFERTR